LEQPHELRAQAEWLRGWADLGTDADRAWREGLANYLENLAGEIAYAQTRDDQRKRAA
jgi:hypothetical protein